MGLTVIKVACGVGRLAGLPIPTADGVKGKISDVVGEQTAFLGSMLDSVKESMDEAGLGDVTEWVEQRLEGTILDPAEFGGDEEEAEVVEEEEEEEEEEVDLPPPSKVCTARWPVRGHPCQLLLPLVLGYVSHAAHRTERTDCVARAQIIQKSFAEVRARVSAAFPVPVAWQFQLHLHQEAMQHLGNLLRVLRRQSHRAVRQKGSVSEATCLRPNIRCVRWPRCSETKTSRAAAWSTRCACRAHPVQSAHTRGSDA